MRELKTKMLRVFNPDTGSYEYVDTLKGKDGISSQLKPEFANDISECTDTSKLYVLPDGYIYAYMLTETDVETGGYKNWLPLATETYNGNTIYGGEGKGYVTGYRLSSSGSASAQAGMLATGFIPASDGAVIRTVGFSAKQPAMGCYVISYDANGTKIKHHQWSTTNFEPDDAYISQFTLDSATYGTGIAFIRISASAAGGNPSPTIVTVNEEIKEGGTTTITEYKWVNTGHAFVSADYEDRIIELEEDVEALKKRPVASSISTMVYAPSPQLPADGSDTADFDADNIDANTIYEYIDALAAKYPQYLTKETLGKDESGTFDWNRYTASRRTYDAWVKQNYPAMYGWTNKSGEISTIPNFTNLLTATDAEIKRNVRYSKSSNAFVSLSGCDSVVIPIPTSGEIIIRCKACGRYGNYPNVYGGTDKSTFQTTVFESLSGWTYDTNDTSIAYFTFTNSVGLKYLVFMSDTIDTNTDIITANETITYTTVDNTTDGLTIYSVSVSPRIDDAMYSAAYIGTVYGSVTAVDTPKQTRTVNGLVFTRNAAKDITPTLVYTLSDYDSRRLGRYATWHNVVYNKNRSSIGTISSIVDGVLTDSNGNVYTRYPMGDVDSKFNKLPVLVIGSSEHGGNENGDPTNVAIITARLIKDLCECRNADNPFLNMLKSEYMIVFCPVINPWGYGKDNGYVNANGVNIDRNFDTPGWGKDSDTRHGAYGGSENETQFFMDTLYASGAKIALANHGLGDKIDAETGEAVSAGMCSYMLGRNQAKYIEPLAQIAETMNVNYGLSFYDMGQAPGDRYGKTRSYMDYIGIEGGAVEMSAVDGYLLHGGARNTARILEANYTLTLQFLQMLIECQS